MLLMHSPCRALVRGGIGLILGFAMVANIGLAADTTKRLKIVSACSSPLWIFHTVGEGGGTLTAPNPVKLATTGDSYEYDIPNIGLASTRFWPGSGCDENGANCDIGGSGGPGLPCLSEGCAPPVDSKWEGTFGCLNGVEEKDCQVNPSSPTGAKLPHEDSWDTSMVDGFTLPYKVKVSENCSGTGPDRTCSRPSGWRSTRART